MFYSLSWKLCFIYCSYSVIHSNIVFISRHKSFNCSVNKFLQCWQGVIELNLILGPVYGRHCSTNGFPVAGAFGVSPGIKGDWDRRRLWWEKPEALCSMEKLQCFISHMEIIRSIYLKYSIINKNSVVKYWSTNLFIKKAVEKQIANTLSLPSQILKSMNLYKTLPISFCVSLSGSSKISIINSDQLGIDSNP